MIPATCSNVIPTSSPLNPFCVAPSHLLLSGMEEELNLVCVLGYFSPKQLSTSLKQEPETQVSAIHSCIQNLNTPPKSLPHQMQSYYSAHVSQDMAAKCHPPLGDT